MDQEATRFPGRITTVQYDFGHTLHGGMQVKHGFLTFGAFISYFHNTVKYE